MNHTPEPKKKPQLPLIYNLTSLAAGMIGLPFLMMALGKTKRRLTVLQRMGLIRAKLLSPIEERPVWIHALSVGEVISAEPIVEKMLSVMQGRPLVFSASTLTGYETAKRQFSNKVASIFYYPYDIIFSVRRAIDAINPIMVVIVETDIWPNFMYCLQRRNIPVLLLNGRMSTKSFKGYRMLGRTFRNALGCFDAVAAQSDIDAMRFRRLGMETEKVVVTGNVKFDQQSDALSKESGESLRLTLGIRRDCRVILFGSTHQGEEEVIIDAIKALKGSQVDLVAVIVPRDPGRSDRVAKMVQNRGLQSSFLSSLSPLQKHQGDDVWIVNTIGILRKLYGVADIAFIGGSLVKEGGHNPIEAAAAGKPILFGPDMSDFLEVAQILESKGAASRVKDSSDMRAGIHRLLTDDNLRRRMGRQAYSVFRENQGAVDKTMTLISQFMPVRGANGDHVD